MKLMEKRLIGRNESIVFYFSVPALAGFMLGWHQAGLGQFMSVWASIVSWIIHFEIFWFVGLFALVIARVLIGGITGNLAVHLMFSSVLTVLIVRPIFWVTYELRLSYVLNAGADPVETVRPFIFFEPTLDFLAALSDLYLQDVLLWPLTTYFVARYGWLPFSLLRTGKAATPEVKQGRHFDGETSSGKVSPPDIARLPFILRLKPQLGTDIITLKAEGHYVRVVTEKGEELIYYRFGDAILQMAPYGIQVHRSYWISNSQLNHEDTVLAGSELRLKNEMVVPVGSTFIRGLKEALEKNTR